MAELIVPGQLWDRVASSIGQGMGGIMGHTCQLAEQTGIWQPTEMFMGVLKGVLGLIKLIPASYLDTLPRKNLLHTLVETRSKIGSIPSLTLHCSLGHIDLNWLYIFQLCATTDNLSTLRDNGNSSERPQWARIWIASTIMIITLIKYNWLTQLCRHNSMQ